MVNFDDEREVEMVKDEFKERENMPYFPSVYWASIEKSSKKQTWSDYLAQERNLTVPWSDYENQDMTNCASFSFKTNSAYSDYCQAKRNFICKTPIIPKHKQKSHEYKVFYEKMRWIEASSQCLLWKGVLVNPVNANEFGFIHTWWEVRTMSNEVFPDDIWAGISRDTSVEASPISIPGQYDADLGKLKQNYSCMSINIERGELKE